MVGFGGQVVPSLIKSIILVRTSYCLSWSVLNWPTTRPTNQSGRILSTDLAARAGSQEGVASVKILKKGLASNDTNNQGTIPLLGVVIRQ